MVLQDKTPESSHGPSMRPNDDTSSTIARSGSPPRSPSKSTKKNRFRHQKDKKEEKKTKTDGIIDMTSDLSFVGSQFV
ncbi:hypothetical protein CcaCcLH18_13032 [Colletotrichum camelliae]|nr:hypothetical protein CcaCcLH18_13032 [Colletotrichum camelliae]